MKLLLDQDLSSRLVKELVDVFPEINHVALLGLERAQDKEVWQYAKLHHFTLFQTIPLPLR